VNSEEFAFRSKLPLLLENPESAFSSVQLPPSLEPLPHVFTSTMHRESPRERKRCASKTLPDVVEVRAEVARLAGGKDDSVVGSVQGGQLLQTLPSGPWC
jgi:hypothetical protein